MSLIKLWHKKNGMHQTKKYLLPFFTALCAVALVFTGCANSADSIDSSDGKKEKFTITVKTQNIYSKTETEGRSIFPVLSGSEYYTLSCKSGDTWQNLDGTYPDYQMLIIPGTYTLKLDAYSDSGKQNHILTGQTELTVTSGMGSTEVPFIMQPPENATGTGNINLVLSAESDTQIAAFEITTDSENLSLEWTKDDTETTYTKGTITRTSVPTGTYHLAIYGNTTTGETIYVRYETLTVWKDLTSSAWIFANGNSSKELKITASDLYSTFYVKGSAGPYNFYTSDSAFGEVTASDTNSGNVINPLQTVSAAVNKCVVSYKPYTIYVDGTVNEVAVGDSDPTAIFISAGKIITIKSFNSEGGTKAVIQADGNGHVMFAGGTVVLEDLVLKGGGNTNYGGGIYLSSGCPLTMKNCTITDCKATTAGGGLYLPTGSTANLSGCTISSNTAQNGAGIYLYNGTLTISSTTMESKTATGAAGALYINNGTATLTDCTFFGNTANTTGSAVYFKDGTLNLNGKIQSGTDDFYIPTGKIITIQTPLSDDSSVLVTPSDHINNTQILQIEADSGVTLADEAGKFKISNTEYIISKEGKLCYLGTTSTTAADNIAVFTNIPAGCEATVNLDNLAQTTWNYHSSIEINGKVTVKATNSTAINSEAACIFTVKNGGTLTLENNVTLKTTVNNPVSCVKVEEGGTLILDGAEITSSSTTNPTGVSITKGTLIMNSGTISSIQGSAIVATDSTITITGGTISNNNGSGSRSTVNLTNCTADIKNLTVTNNYANWYGGGIMISGSGTYTFTNCKISNNSTGYSNGAPGYGGGIYIDTTGTVTFTGCTITGNSAINNGSSSKGGGIYLKSGTLTTTGCTISSNTTKNGSTETTGNGSQIYAVAGSVYNGTTLAADEKIDEYSE